MQDSIKRPSLLWLSRNDVLRVRNQIIQLYIGPDEVIAAAPPDKTWGVKEIEIRCMGGIPIFEFSVRTHSYDAPSSLDAMHFKYWLKVQKGKNPCWDRTFNGVTEIVRYEFNAAECSIVSRLVKYYAQHFPFSATDNYIANNGQPIA